MVKKHLETRIIAKLAESDATSYDLIELCYDDEYVLFKESSYNSDEKKSVYNKFNRLIHTLKKKNFIIVDDSQRDVNGQYSKKIYRLNYQGIYEYLLLQYLAPANVKNKMLNTVKENLFLFSENQGDIKMAKGIHQMFYSLELDKEHRYSKTDNKYMTKTKALKMSKYSGYKITQFIANALQNFILSTNKFYLGNQKNIFDYFELFVVATARTIRKELINRETSIEYFRKFGDIDLHFVEDCFSYIDMKGKSIEEFYATEYLRESIVNYFD